MTRRPPKRAQSAAEGDHSFFPAYHAMHQLIAGFDCVRGRRFFTHKDIKMSNKELTRMEILRMAMESEEARIKAEAERDAVLKTKAQIGAKREATAMATASKAVAESRKARAELGFCQHHATIAAVQQATGRAHEWQPLAAWCRDHGVPPKFVPDAALGKVRAWPAQAWRACHAVDLFTLFGGETV